MKFEIDSEAMTLTLHKKNNQSHAIPLYSREAFELISELWLKVGWNEKYPYTFSWFGRPIIQLPEDIIRIQEVIYKIKPDLIIETGVAHGGSLILYASLCKAMGKGKVVGVDIEIRPHNRKAIETHELNSYIALIEGSSVDRSIVDRVSQYVYGMKSVLVILDSNHSYDHVMSELDLYSPFVTSNSYIVATDGSMEILCDVPRGRADWAHDNPALAAIRFAKDHPEFVLEKPEWIFNESKLRENITHWPSAWLRRK